MLGSTPDTPAEPKPVILKFKDVDYVPMAEITKSGIKYGDYNFTGKGMALDPNTNKMKEVTFVKWIEREWMLGGGAYKFNDGKYGIIFNLDKEKLKKEAEIMYKDMLNKLN